MYLRTKTRQTNVMHHTERGKLTYKERARQKSDWMKCGDITALK